MTNALIRGYTNFGFEAWTVPCLYVAGKYLRMFAIKADEQSGSNASFTVGFQDDFNPEGAKNEKLEDAARVLNRIFTLCHSDRYTILDAALQLTDTQKRAPLMESRKWGIYSITNLLFKTYFKLNSIPLSKNILKALEAGRGDIPGLEAFPKSHQVTFKYYLGVIHFLEENYVQVCVICIYLF
jgi:hypothetical protein